MSKFLVVGVLSVAATFWAQSKLAALMPAVSSDGNQVTVSIPSAPGLPEMPTAPVTIALFSSGVFAALKGVGRLCSALETCGGPPKFGDEKEMEAFRPVAPWFTASTIAFGSLIAWLN